MDARFTYQGNAVAAKFAKYINSAGAVVSNSTLPAATQELVKIRASQINGCAACTDMHTKDAEHAGESSVRLHLVAVWGGKGLHRGRASRSGTHRARHPHRRCRRRCHRRGLGECGQALRR